MHSRPRPRSARRPTPERRYGNGLSEATRHATRAAVGPARRPGSELGRRPRLGGGRVDAAPPLPDPRLGGRLVLRVGVEPDAREHARRRAGGAEDGARAVEEIVRLSREGRAPKNDPALYAL